jgi:hypothetical protein
MHTHIHAREQAAREGRAYCCRPDLAVNRLNVAIQSLEGRDPTDTQATLSGNHETLDGPCIQALVQPITAGPLHPG